MLFFRFSNGCLENFNRKRGSTELAGAGIMSLIFGSNIGDGLETASIPLMGIQMVLVDDEV